MNVGLDDYTAAAAGKPYYRFEIYIDGVASGIFTALQESGGNVNVTTGASTQNVESVGASMNFSISGVKQLSAGSHTIDLRGKVSFANGLGGNADIRLIAFNGVYTYFN